MELLIYKKDGHILTQLEKGQRYIVKKEKTFFVGEYTGQDLYFSTLDGKDISLITRSNTISPNVKIVECDDDLLRKLFGYKCRVTSDMNEVSIGLLIEKFVKSNKLFENLKVIENETGKSIDELKAIVETKISEAALKIMTEFGSNKKVAFAEMEKETNKIWSAFIKKMTTAKTEEKE